jgi:hypothetical protein
MRQYTFSVSQHGGQMNWPGQECESSARIRVVAAVLFRKWFGNWPERSWHKDGFMAEAWDRRGRRITVDQVNLARRA